MAEDRQPAGRPDGPAPPQRAADAPVSVVVPVYNEADNIAPLADAVADALGDRPYELLFVDDGSTDATAERIAALAAADDRVGGISFTRNFGHQCALAAGLLHAGGQAVICMDGDLQHPPSLLPTFLARWREGYDVVQGRREDADGVGPLKRTTSRGFYRVFRALSGVPIEPGMSDFRLLDRAVVDEINRIGQHRPFFRGLVAWMGYPTATVAFEPARRRAGESKYTLAKMLALARTGLLAFSPVPLRLGLALSAVAALAGLAVLICALAAWAATGSPAGWAVTLGALLLPLALLLAMLGVQGEALLRVHERLQNRPPFVVRRTIGRIAPPRPDEDGEG